ncbi:MAG: hypothetical protein J5547_04035 [Clostridia bacterium]|nr:hypothetical protein [Clostridia bacterium]
MKKLLALVLCLLITAACFAACGSNGNESKDEPASEQSAVSAEESAEPVSEEDPIQKILDNPDIYKGSDYEGRTFKVLTFGVNATALSEFVYNEDTTEEAMPQTVNEAIKRRNDLVYDLLGVTVAEEYYQAADRFGGTSIRKVNELINEGNPDYHLLSICLYDCGTLATANNLWDLYSLRNFNPENPWWEQYFNETVTIANQLYFTIGDVGINNKGSTPCVYYNTRLITDLGLDDPLVLAQEGKWTIDKALEYSRAMPHDDAAAVVKYKETFGWAGQNDDMYAMVYGSGARILSPDPDGFPQLSINNETAINTVGKVLALMGDSSYVSGNDLFSQAQWPMVLLKTAFEEGRCLFYSGSVSSAVELNMDDVFGILPVAKYTEEQEHYYSLINTWVTNAYCIAANLDKEGAEFAGAVLDVMGFYSWSSYPDSLAFNYYEKMLKNQKLTKEESEAMLDLIFEARGCELGAIFQIGRSGGHTVNNMLVELIEAKGTKEFVSLYTSYEGFFQSDVETLKEYFTTDKN